MRGMKPNWIACWVRLKAPEITAWLAMIVASSAMITTGTFTMSGIIRKKGSLMSAAVASGEVCDSTIAPCPM